MKNIKFIWRGFVLLFSIVLLSCEDFVEVDAPGNKLIRNEVFRSEETARSALTGIYNQLALAGYSNGSTSSITYLAGLSSDNLKNIHVANLERNQFQEHEILPGNSSNFRIWSSAYNIIYMTNAFLEGLAGSDNLTQETRDQLEGHGKFLRAFSYFYLVNLYGDVPLILTSNYLENESVHRDPQEAIYSQIIEDLTSAVEVLENDYMNGERTMVNAFAAKAFLARVYLYLGDWEMAETSSSEVINESATYEILDDLNEVFKADSREAIWQLSPMGRGTTATHTNEGNTFIIHPIFSFFATIQLENPFVAEFQVSDRRVQEWTGFHEGRNAYYPYKYKIWNSNEFPIVEYSMVMRLAEQYLIRAEARTHLDKMAEAVEDLDVIKTRAGVDLLKETNPSITKDDLLDEIMEERRKELFAEWGHRWFDLKRTGRAGEIFNSQPLWENTDVLYPIPEDERIKNNNLTQNPGY